MQEESRNSEYDSSTQQCRRMPIVYQQVTYEQTPKSIEDSF